MKIKQPFLLLIMNCKKYKEKAMHQKRTWLASLPSFLPYYHVIGVPILDRPFFFHHSDHILFVKTPDDYLSLPKKVVAAYEAVQTVFDFEYIFKTDDDQSLIQPTFFDELRNILSLPCSESPHYGGYIVRVSKTHSSDYHIFHPELPKNVILHPCTYCNGRFYFLSSKAVQKVIERKQWIHREYLEDYAIGYHLRDLFRNNILHIPTANVFIDVGDTS